MLPAACSSSLELQEPSLAPQSLFPSDVPRGASVGIPREWEALSSALGNFMEFFCFLLVFYTPCPLFLPWKLISV